MKKFSLIILSFLFSIGIFSGYALAACTVSGCGYDCQIACSVQFGQGDCRLHEAQKCINDCPACADPCENVRCPDYCSGSVRYYSGYCSDGQCYYNKNQDCGTYDCGLWGPDYCDGNDVYHSRTCYDKGCSGGSCYSNSGPDTDFVKVCDYACINGGCMPDCVKNVIEVHIDDPNSDEDPNQVWIKVFSGGEWQVDERGNFQQMTCVHSSSLDCTYTVYICCSDPTPWGNDATITVRACDARGNCEEETRTIPINIQDEDCDDGNPCTDDDFVPAVGCVNAPLTDGSPPKDGDPNAVCCDDGVKYNGECCTATNCIGIIPDSVLGECGERTCSSHWCGHQGVASNCAPAYGVCGVSPSCILGGSSYSCSYIGDNNLCTCDKYCSAVKDFTCDWQTCPDECSFLDYCDETTDMTCHEYNYMDIVCTELYWGLGICICHGCTDCPGSLGGSIDMGDSICE